MNKRPNEQLSFYLTLFYLNLDTICSPEGCSKGDWAFGIAFVSLPAISHT